MTDTKGTKKLQLTFIVSGQAYEDSFPENQPLQAAIQHVLAQTKNTGQPPENWVVTFDGQLLDPKKSLADLGLTNGQRLLLNPRTGRGGA